MRRGRSRCTEREAIAARSAVGDARRAERIVAMRCVSDRAETERQYEADEQCSQPAGRRSESVQPVHRAGHPRSDGAYEGPRFL